MWFTFLEPGRNKYSELLGGGNANIQFYQIYRPSHYCKSTEKCLLAIDKLALLTRTMLLPPTNRVARRYCFQSCVLAMVSVHRGSHVTITHDALDLTAKGPSQLHSPWTSYQELPWLWPSPGHQTWDPLLLTSGGQHWRPVQTCSL